MKKTDITKITTYIRQNPHMSAADIAQHFGYSQYHFSRLFKQQMGVSLRDYLSGIKIERSVHTLAHKNNVIDSQLEAGYQSAGTFSNIFKRFSGISPKKHTQKIIQFGHQLHLLQQDKLNQAVLYMPFSHPQHKQTHGLTIHICNRSQSTEYQTNSLLFIALYPKAIPQGIPSLGICLSQQSTYCINAIPNGTYYVMVIELLRSKNPFQFLHLDNFKRDIIRTPISFPLTEAQTVTLTLRDKQPEDPPINVHPLKLLFDVLKPPTKQP